MRSRFCWAWLQLLWRLPAPEPSRLTGSWVETEETRSSPRRYKIVAQPGARVLPGAPVAPTLRRVSFIDRDVTSSEESRRDDNQRRPARGLARIRGGGSTAA